MGCFIHQGFGQNAIRNLGCLGLNVVLEMFTFCSHINLYTTCTGFAKHTKLTHSSLVLYKGILYTFMTCRCPLLVCREPLLNNVALQLKADTGYIILPTHTSFHKGCKNLAQYCIPVVCTSVFENMFKISLKTIQAFTRPSSLHFEVLLKKCSSGIWNSGFMLIFSTFIQLKLSIFSFSGCHSYSSLFLYPPTHQLVLCSTMSINGQREPHRSRSGTSHILARHQQQWQTVFCFGRFLIGAARPEI